MRADRTSYDFNNWGNSTTNSRLQLAQTPKSKSKINPTLTNNIRRSVSPIRDPYSNTQNDKISHSPLRVPLQQAISRCVRERSIDKSTSRRTLGKSSRRQEASFIQTVKKISTEEQINNRNVKAHSQTLKFIKKHFNINYIIPTEQFISKILQQYGNMWDNQNLQQLLEDFTYKVQQIFGVDGIDPKSLIIKTKNNGMLGLIMTIFKELKQQQSTRNSNYTSFSRNPQVMSINKSFQQRLNYNQNVQNIKNVVQEFMESMYKCMETQIYNKFNIEMRRMVLKYRQAEKIIKKVNQKITLHADFFDLQQKLRKQKKIYEQKLSQSDKVISKLQNDLNKQRQNNNEIKNYQYRIQEQNKKLKQNMQRLQSALINKALQGNSTNSVNPMNCMNDPSLSRRSTMPFGDRSQQFMNTPMNISTMPTVSQPFQIKIDTHIIQKDLGPPSTYTTTTLGNPLHNMNSLSPLKRQQNKENIYTEGRYSYSPYSSRLTTTRMH